MHDLVISMLQQRGVSLSDMAVLVLEMQQKYVPLNYDIALEHVKKVLEKREVQNAILTGIAIDQAAEADLIDEPLLSILKNDDALYGIDEILALSITNIYGTIGLTNFGYLDKAKPGILAELNSKTSGKVNTFLDDIVAAIIAAACSRIAHSYESNA
ncbi:MAG: phosphatidylglycerophosphatase A [Alkaliphilus sp.]|nr:phosphatidylglycerophosphatase A [bacterium AH-315-L21]MBN4062918.1 phosphatidylglycerophosphatase A [Alkaliphilus sp. AH-315-G20]MBN4069493.1 phosphatidylglycerophosphatase A [bacterium AH-315-G05]PHS36264.1 MAG: phosphatidylglycerophosphatase A [Alkaliphilus sp.]